ncbi:MAG: hypothetical protein K6U74_19115, partial [Firmicutes bacterium]|nr:hypothetical protein [Bacillota bacterium]
MRQLFVIAGLILLTSILAFTASATPPGQVVFVIGENTCLMDGKPVEMDVVPFTENGRAYVPVRYLALAIGMTGDDILWSPSSQTVTLKKDGDTVTMAVGGKVMYKNDTPREMDAAPLLRGGRAFVPARCLAEAFGFEVGWDEKNQAVLIGPPGRLPEAPVREGESADDGIAGDLPVVGSYEKFKELMADLQARGGLIRGGGAGAMAGAGEKALVQNDSSAPAQSVAKRQNYSATNVQVEGVDEAD